MGIRIRVLAVALAVALAAPAAAQARDDSVTSFDGTRIMLSFFPAEGLADGAKAPTVLIGHGWAQSRETNPNAEGSQDLFGLVGPGPFRRAGFNVLTWDARGFGQSGGTVEVDSPDFEARDVQALIDYVGKQPEAQLDKPGDPRVGMSGASYGGGIQFVTAARDSRVDVIAPDISWHSLLTALFKDGAVKAGWGDVLFASGQGSSGGTLDPHIQSSYTSGLATGGISDEDRAWYDARGPRHLLDRIHIPTFLIQGTADTLFTLQESIDNYTALEKNGIPLKMMWFCGGHGSCFTGTGEPNRLGNAVVTWFRHHLKNDRSVDTGARFEWLADDAKWRTADDFPLPAGTPLSGSGAGTLPLAQTTDSGQPQIAATPAANAVNVPISPPAEDTQVLGAPRLELTYTATGASTGVADHVYAQIVNTRTGQVVGNQVTPIPIHLDGAEHSIARPLEPIASAAPKNAGYQLQIAAYSGVYGPQRADGSVDFKRVQVELPTVGERPVATSRFAVGSLFRRATRGRALRVALFASPRATRVVVRLRDRRRRVVGSSKPMTVDGRAKATVRLRRRLARGRYTITVTGRAPDGRTLRAQRTVRFKR